MKDKRKPWKYLSIVNRCFLKIVPNTLLCKFGKHKWQDSCKCTICGKTRNRHHSWQGCVCTVCQSVRDEGHDWNGCTCRTCGRIREENHDLTGCWCKICKNEIHQWKLIDEILNVYKKGGGDKTTTSGAILNVKEVKTSTWQCKRCGKIKSQEEIISEKDIDFRKDKY
ncbi:hypothetical protein JW935_11975 [candidate division KSB1 bacterium]|nr:hypothetical protein [candidate division KSB1 bacterium]